MPVMSKVHVGDQWGRLHCVDVELRSITETAEDTNGKKYETGAYQEIYVYKLECECGKDVEIVATQFLGKRRVRDCGCGLGDEDICVFVGVTMPIKLRRKILAYAEERKMKMSHAAVRLVEAGLRVVAKSVESTSMPTSAKTSVR